MSRPLENIRVIDLTRALAGPLCTALLADLGADVIKVEALPHGDASRQWGPFAGDRSLYFMSINRNKRSIAIDLRAPRGQRLLTKLVADADVLVENFRPGVLAKLGIDVAELRLRHPDLVVSTISGFGPVGPDRGVPGLDQVIQGMSGLMSVTGTAEDGALRVGIPIVDVITGFMSALGIAAALAGRAGGRPAAHIHTSLLETAISAMTFQAQQYLTLGEVGVPHGNDHPVIAPYGTFRTQDMAINLSVGSTAQWRSLCATLGAPGMAERTEYADGQQRLYHRDQLRADVEALLQARPGRQWITLLRAAGIPCGPIYRMDEVFNDPQVTALGVVQPIQDAQGREDRLVRGPLWIDGRATTIIRHPPELGQHTREVLEQSGVGPNDIAELLAVRAVAEPPGQHVGG